MAYTMEEIAEAGERSRRLDEFPNCKFEVTDASALLPVADSLNRAVSDAASNAPETFDPVGIETATAA
jgi:hypothetical protein